MATQRSISLDSLEARARRRADMVDSEFWTAPQVRALAEATFAEFYLTAACKYDEFFTTSSVFTTTAGTPNISLAGTFSLLKLRGVRHENEWFLNKVDLLEAPNLVGPLTRGKPRFYSLRLDPELELPNIDLYPTPDAVYRITVHYVPIFGLEQIQVAHGSASKALYMLAGWDEYIVIKMAIAMKDSEESDCSVLIGEAGQLMEAMERQMTPVDLGQPSGMVQWGGKSALSIYDDPELFEGYFG